MLDNHLASQGQKEYDKQGSCPNCGDLNSRSIVWCVENGEECIECDYKGDDKVCIFAENRERCNGCSCVSLE